MRPLILTAIGVAAALLPVLPASACSIALGTNGRLDVNETGTILGSEEGTNGRTGTVTTILAVLESAHVDVSAPTLVAQGMGYDASLQSLQYAYSADVLGVLNVATQPYTSASSSFAIDLLSGVTVTISLQNRISNPNGFAAGTYRTQQVVTCRP